MSSRRLAAFTLCGTLSLCSTAFAHISLTGPGFANQNQVLTFNVGHGCAGADTVKVEVTIPKEITSVRAMPNVFGEVVVNSDDAGTVTSVVWSKEKPRAKDDAYYQLAIRVKLPDAPFTKVLFPTKQTCKAADGKETIANWAQTAEEAAAVPMGEEALPAPTLLVLPTRVTGWNKLTIKDKLTDLSVFSDAQIVWSGDAAYSSNPATVALIKTESDVTELTEIKAGAEIWVKY